MLIIQDSLHVHRLLISSDQRKSKVPQKSLQKVEMVVEEVDLTDEVSDDVGVIARQKYSYPAQHDLLISKTLFGSQDSLLHIQSVTLSGCLNTTLDSHFPLQISKTFVLSNVVGVIVELIELVSVVVIETVED